MGIPKSISQLLSPSSACDSPSSFSSLPWLSSQNAHGSHLKRSQLKSLQKSRLKSRQKSQQKSRERNRGRSRPNQESQQANRSLQLSTMQSGRQHLLVAPAGGIWPARTVLSARKVACSADILFRTNATKNIPLRAAPELKETL